MNPQKAIGTLIAFLGAILVLYGAGLFLAQSLAWFDSDHWISLPLIRMMFGHATILRPAPIESFADFPEPHLLRWVPCFSDLPPRWISAPAGWFGAHRVVMWVLNGISVPVAATVLALVAFLVGSNMRSASERSG
jgi:hypothetical protein